jgi:hypothetical protein
VNRWHPVVTRRRLWPWPYRSLYRQLQP